MILVWLIVIALAGGAAAWLSSRWGGRAGQLAPRWISLGALAIDLALLAWLWVRHYGGGAAPASGAWLVEFQRDWIPQLGIGVHLALDGLSLLLLLLTAFLGILAVACSWTEIRDNTGFFHFNVMWILAGIIGVFLSLDLFLFYFFWELMLIPMYFLIAIWGHENRLYASFKFFLFTQAGGLLMLLAILALYFIHGRQSGVYTFDFTQLRVTTLTPFASAWIALGFLAAFLVKLPAFPFHPWLPDAHTEAPTAGSVILAGLLLKTGAFGLLRFVLPMFPDAVAAFAWSGMLLGVIGILYGAVVAFAQTDLKRLVAYTSVSHMGFVLLGVFARNELALQGAVMQMLCHGLSTGALFILVGALQERIHTRDLERMGGLWDAAPRMGAVAMFFAMASLGLPGLGNFVAEILTLLGAYRVDVTLTVLATLGLVAATVYSLWIVQRAFHGERRGAHREPQPNAQPHEQHGPRHRGASEPWAIADLSARELAIAGSLVVALLWLGLYPQPALRTARPALIGLQAAAPAIVNALPTRELGNGGRTFLSAADSSRRPFPSAANSGERTFLPTTSRTGMSALRFAGGAP